MRSSCPPPAKTSAPELALVDSAVAAQARAALSRPDDTLAPIERLVHAHRIATTRAQRLEALGVLPLVASAAPKPSDAETETASAPAPLEAELFAANHH
jgi:hypothetical protein